MRFELWIALGAMVASGMLLAVAKGRAGIAIFLKLVLFAVAYAFSDRFGPPWLHWLVIALGLALLILTPNTRR